MLQSLGSQRVGHDLATKQQEAGGDRDPQQDRPHQQRVSLTTPRSAEREGAWRLEPLVALSPPCASVSPSAEWAVEQDDLLRPVQL